MKTKKVVVAACLILALFAIYAAPAHAVWSNCSVIKVGPNGSAGTNMILLKSCSGNWTGERWYRLTALYENKMLATALTAMANGTQLQVNLSSYAAASSVTIMYLTKTAECP